MLRQLRGRSLLRLLLCLSIGGLSILLTSAATPLSAQDIDLHPAHTHTGTCEQPGEIVSTLSPVSSAYVVDGESLVVPEVIGSPEGIPVEFSSTTLPASLAQITSGQFIIDVKVSLDDQVNSVACGPIGGLMLGSSDLPVGLLPVNDSGHFGSAWLHDNGDGTTTLSITLVSVGPPIASMAGGPGPATGSTIPVAIQNFAYQPATIVARAGDTVVFTNNDAAPHTVTQEPAGSGFQSAPIEQGATYTLTIDEPGVYPFFCEFHPAMKGVIDATG